MKPLIDPAFWSDPDIESKAPGVKLCALWLFTNSQTSLLGLCGASMKRFTFETGLPAEALAKTLEALPKSFSKIGETIFVRNYVRHQFGSGDKLTRNNFFVALSSLFLNVREEELRQAILSEYPEFEQALHKGLPRAYQAQGKERKGKEGKRKSAEKEIFDIPEPLSSLDGFEIQWQEFVRHRRQIKKPLTELAGNAILQSLSERPHDAIKALQTAVRRSWQGFEWSWLDDYVKGSNGHKPDHRAEKAARSSAQARAAALAMWVKRCKAKHPTPETP